MSKVWMFIGVSLGFVILGSFIVFGEVFLLNANQPELYCVNASGDNTSVCTNASTIFTNTSEVCTVSNGLCGAGGASGSNETLILAHECLEVACDTFVFTPT